MLKILQARLQQYMNRELHKLDLEKTEEPKINCQHPLDYQKSKMAVWGGLTNSCEKKRREKQRRKGKI